MDTTRIGFSALGIGVALDRFNLKQESMIIFTALLVIDFVLGIIHAYMKDKKSVKSSIMSRGALRKLVRLTLPMSAALILKGMGFAETRLLVTSIMGVLIASEGYSILRHYLYISTKKELSEMDAITYVINRLLDIVRPTVEQKKKKEPKTK